MFYKFDIYGLFAGTTSVAEDRTTTVAPPNDSNKQWNWNGYNWVGLPLDWKYVQAEYVAPPVVEETPAPTEPTPPTE